MISSTYDTQTAQFQFIEPSEKELQKIKGTLVPEENPATDVNCMACDCACDCNCGGCYP